MNQLESILQTLPSCDKPSSTMASPLRSQFLRDDKGWFSSVALLSPAIVGTVVEVGIGIRRGLARHSGQVCCLLSICQMTAASFLITATLAMVLLRRRLIRLYHSTQSGAKTRLDSNRARQHQLAGLGRLVDVSQDSRRLASSPVAKSREAVVARKGPESLETT